MRKVERRCMDGSTILGLCAETKEEADELDAMVARGKVAGATFADQRAQRAQLGKSPVSPNAAKADAPALDTAPPTE